MARKPRIEFPRAFYHVIIRGNHRHERSLPENKDLTKLVFVVDMA